MYGVCMATTTRIIQRAIDMMSCGVDPIEAVEAACNAVATTPVARDRARNIFSAMVARAERG